MMSNRTQYFSWFLVFKFILVGLLVSCTNKPVDPKQQNDEGQALSAAWTKIDSPTKGHLRGLDAASAAVIWASGTEGSVLRSIDSGKTWTLFQLPDCEDIDFRDIEGFDENHAAAMSSGNGVRFYYTEDGGINWSLSYEDTNRKVFFDGMDFNGQFGIAYGDPQDGKLSLLQSKDGGRSWEKMDRVDLPLTSEGEAGFAASGTGIVLGKSSVWITTGGGPASRVFLSSAEHSWQAINTPLASGEGTGIFSSAFFNDQIGVVVGGSYIDSTKAEHNSAYTLDGGLSWVESESNPLGYRSCVAFNTLGLAVATGRTGTDFSRDFGKHWQSLSSQGYFSCVVGPDYIIGVGRNGKIGRMEIEFDMNKMLQKILIGLQQAD